jgi:hypothetical protein
MNSLEAISYGPEVRSLLAAGGGHVLAMLSNAIYIESLEGYVAGIVGEDAVDGPLSLRVRDLTSLIETLQGRQDLPFRCANGTMGLGGLVCISLVKAREWVPHMPQRLGTPVARDEAAQALAEAIAAYAEGQAPGKADGLTLAHLVRLCHSERSEESKDSTWHDAYRLRFFAALRMTMESWRSITWADTPDGRVLGRIADGILRFVGGLDSGENAIAAEALASLVGLGPGLTPSGDDLVSGIMAVLVWQARLGALGGEVPEGIIARVHMAAARTNRISARLLHYAGEGVLYAPAMHLGTALLAGDAKGVREPARRLFGIGNTSGADLVTGLLIGCLAAQRAR